MTMSIAGAEAGKFIFTDNGQPDMDPGTGMQLGIADDLANSMLSQSVALGLMNLIMPAAGRHVRRQRDRDDLAADDLRRARPTARCILVLPDMMATFTNGGTPVGKAAINATVDLQIQPSTNGLGVAIQLGTPNINVDVLHDIANETRFANEDLSKAVELDARKPDRFDHRAARWHPAPRHRGHPDEGPLGHRPQTAT